ncbi:MAG TPA: DedA family protein [Gammaproteobacteria bacterium]|nr:DedA family protein [Gammaproteobacteria bacterium]HET7587720.1 DedA family protein [Gammaproteobacteria bacterium]
MFTNILNALLDWVSANPGWAGVAVFAVACVESLLVIGYLVPGIFILFGIGALIGSGYLAFWPIAIWAAAGAIVGDVASYLVGYIYRDRLQQGWPFHRHPELYAKGARFFDAHGGKSIVFGRFVGAVRPLIPAIAGMTGMSPVRFTIIDVIASVLWAPIYLFPGMVFGASLELATAVAGRLMLLIGVLAVCLWLLWLAAKQIALRVRQPLRRVSNGVLMGGAAAGFVIVGMLAVLWTPLGDLLPGETPPPRRLAAAEWRNGGWRDIAAVHASHDDATPLNVQFAGDPAALAAALRNRGWRSPPPLTLTDALHWLAPHPPITDLPLLPQLRSRHRERLVLVRPAGPQAEWVLQLWESGWQTAEGAPISIGHVRLYHPDTRVPLLTLPRPDGQVEAALDQLSTALDGAARLVRGPRKTLLILSAEPPPPAGEASATAPAD